MMNSAHRLDRYAGIAAPPAIGASAGLMNMPVNRTTRPDDNNLHKTFQSDRSTISLDFAVGNTSFMSSGYAHFQTHAVMLIPGGRLATDGRWFARRFDLGDSIGQGDFPSPGTIYGSPSPCAS